MFWSDSLGGCLVFRKEIKVIWCLTMYKKRALSRHDSDAEKISAATVISHWRLNWQRTRLATTSKRKSQNARSLITSDIFSCGQFWKLSDWLKLFQSTSKWLSGLVEKCLFSFFATIFQGKMFLIYKIKDTKYSLHFGDSGTAHSFLPWVLWASLPVLYAALLPFQIAPVASWAK